MYLSIDQAVEILTNGGIVAIPTETVYGLAGLATKPKTIQKIYKVKNRPNDNPLICHFYSFEQLRKYIPEISPAAEVLISHFSPGPISFLFDSPKNSDLKPTAKGRDTIVCRIPNSELSLKILEKIDIPLVAPSANTSGKFSPTSAHMVKADLGQKIDGIVDGGESEIGLESTIIDCRDPNIIYILRPGSIGKLELEARLKYFDIQTIVIDSQKPEDAPVTPGQKYKHYSPVTKIIKIKDWQDIPETSKFAILAIADRIQEIELLMPDISEIKFINLGQSDSQIAHNLYENLYKLDQFKLDKAYLIDFELPVSSLSKAIRDKIDKIAS